MIIDAHQHYWKIDCGDYRWLSPELGVLYQDYLPNDLDPLLKAGGVTGTIIVQASDTEDETRFLLDKAKADPSVFGVVGWADLKRRTFRSASIL